jgi:RNA polymerase sigma factor (TIGR02999 family)
MSDATDITVLLRAVASGDATALEQLLPQVYSELRRLARSKLRNEQPGHTLTPTDLVHEAYLKLVPIRNVEWQSRAHFFAIASRAMRHVLIDHAERRSAVKRGGGQALLTLSDDGSATATSLDDLIALGDALSRLERVDARQARVVECRFFGGLSLDETAEALNISAATVSRDWTFARAWLHRELDVGSGDRTGAPVSH